jgi:hypothetical protein
MTTHVAAAVIQRFEFDAADDGRIIGDFQRVRQFVTERHCGIAWEMNARRDAQVATSTCACDEPQHAADVVVRERPGFDVKDDVGSFESIHESPERGRLRIARCAEAFNGSV